MPDVEIKPTNYRDERPKEFFDEFHARVRAGEPEAHVYEIVRIATTLHALVAFRARAIGSENVPAGPLIVAPNHASFMDHFFTGAFVRRRIQFMAKSQLFGSPIPQYIFNHGGVFPVRRGLADEEAFISAFQILARGGAVGMYCEGRRSRNGQVGTEAKSGIGRLALESGAPVVPVAILGSHQVRNWKRLQFPRVTVSYGTPLRFEPIADPTRDQQQEAADAILNRIRTLHDELERLGHRGARRAARAQPST
ncbi:MAG: lysophospholipid acyltransferase family protein [Solirubrobacteraceae bacterium]